ncbi:TPA: helix-turn-helix domain-containing protein [Providencia alcalifaciens]|nr:helix-turn-helix transcriptional regulator [Providencia sp. JUb39]MBC5792247.1 helix-turn-helix transcriptional regulator [Providencia sp. JUb39]
MKNREINIRFGMYVQYMRKHKGISGAEFARRLNVSQQQVSRYEKGVTTVNLLMMEKIINALELRWDEFIHQIIYAESPSWLRVRSRTVERKIPMNNQH